MVPVPRTPTDSSHIAGTILSARSARAHHDGDLRDASRGHARLIEERAAKVLAVGEDIRLHRQERAARVDEVHARQPVLGRNLLRAQFLFNGHGEVRAALDGRVIGYDDARRARDDADAGHDARRLHRAAGALVHAVRPRAVTAPEKACLCVRAESAGDQRDLGRVAPASAGSPGSTSAFMRSRASSFPRALCAAALAPPPWEWRASRRRSSSRWPCMIAAFSGSLGRVNAELRRNDRRLALRRQRAHEARARLDLMTCRCRPKMFARVPRHGTKPLARNSGLDDGEAQHGGREAQHRSTAEVGALRRRESRGRVGAPADRLRVATGACRSGPFPRVGTGSVCARPRRCRWPTSSIGASRRPRARSARASSARAASRTRRPRLAAARTPCCSARVRAMSEASAQARARAERARGGGARCRSGGDRSAGRGGASRPPGKSETWKFTPPETPSSWAWTSPAAAGDDRGASAASTRAPRRARSRCRAPGASTATRASPGPATWLPPHGDVRRCRPAANGKWLFPEPTNSLLGRRNKAVQDHRMLSRLQALEERAAFGGRARAAIPTGRELTRSWGWQFRAARPAVGRRPRWRGPEFAGKIMRDVR